MDYLAALRDGRFEEIEHRNSGKNRGGHRRRIGGHGLHRVCRRLDAKDVYLVYRRSYSQMPAEADERIEALEAGVHFLLLNQPVDYLTDDKIASPAEIGPHPSWESPMIPDADDRNHRRLRMDHGCGSW